MVFAVQQGVLVPCDRLTFDNQGPVPERPINVNPGLTFCSVFVFFHSYALLRVKVCVTITISRSKGSTVFCNVELHVLRRQNLA